MNKDVNLSEIDFKIIHLWKTAYVKDNMRSISFIANDIHFFLRMEYVNRNWVIKQILHDDDFSKTCVFCGSNANSDSCVFFQTRRWELSDFFVNHPTLRLKLLFQ